MPTNPDAQIVPLDDPVRRAREGFEQRAQEARSTGSHNVYTPSQTVPPSETPASRPTDIKLPDPPALPIAQNFCVHCGNKVRASQALQPAEAPAVIIHIYPNGDIKVIRNGQQTLVTSQP